MTFKYAGGVFKIPFPFTDLTTSKARPALALCEPDIHGDIEFVFITTKINLKGTAHVLEVPEGLLPFPSVMHVGKSFLLNRAIIQKELGAALFYRYFS